MLRFLLVEAAQVTARSIPEWRSKYFHLRMRRGRKIAKVAMARRLAVRLYWMMRTQNDATFATLCTCLSRSRLPTRNCIRVRRTSVSGGILLSSASLIPEGSTVEVAFGVASLPDTGTQSRPSRQGSSSATESNRRFRRGHRIRASFSRWTPRSRLRFPQVN